jgi:hypothetical protein
MKNIKVYCGETIEEKCDKQLHPVKFVELAQSLVLSNTNEICYSNNPDFVMGIKYIAKKHNIDIEFFLNGVSCGDDIEPIFNDFNRSLDMINELGATED